MTEYTSEDRASPAPKLGRGRQIRLVVLILVGVVLVFGVAPRVWPLLFPTPPEAVTHNEPGTFAATDKQWQTLRFEKVHSGSFQNGFTTDGMIASDDDRTTTVFSPFTGRVTRVFAAAGDHVRAGQPLFAVIAIEAAQNDADIVSTTAQFNAAQAEEARQHDLAQNQGAAVKDWQQSQVDLANARGSLAAARARRAILGGGISHGEAIVRAPVSGTVAQRLIGVGQNISSAAGGSATQAFTISDFSQLWVIGNLHEEDAMKAQSGQKAVVTLLVDPTHPIQTHVDYVSPTLDANSRRLTVRAVIANPDGRIKPQMFATFRLLTGGARNSQSVPESAVIYEGATARVWVAGAGHRLALRNVTAGETVDGNVEISSGLRNGETVVTAGSLFIDRGAKSD